MEVARSADSENGPQLTLLGTWANALTAIGDFDVARTAIGEALVKARTAGSVRRLLTALGQAIHLAMESGDLGSADRLLLEVRQQPLSTPLTRASRELSEARVALAKGDASGALAWSRRAVGSFESISPTQESLLQTQNLLARCLNAAGRFDEALAVSTRSVATSTARLGGMKHSSIVGTALLEVSTARFGLSEVEMARTAVAQALEHLVATVGPNGPSARRAERLAASLPPAGGVTASTNSRRN